MKKIILMTTIFLSLSACSDKEPENLMSPCVSAKNGIIADPCDRTPINTAITSYEFRA